MTRSLAKPPAKRPRGRPTLHGSRLEVRSIGLPAATWKALDARAKEQRTSTGAMIRAILVSKLDPAP